MKKHRILIVEDNLLFALELEQNLVKWGHEVLAICDTGKKALELLATETPTLILMDIVLKGNLNGIALSKKIQDTCIPVIFMTVRKDLETFEATKGSTGINFLVKPFDMLTLRGAIELNPSLQEEKIKAENPKDFLFIRKNKELVRVKKTDIDYVKSDRNFCDIFVDDKVFYLRTSLKRFEDELPAEYFQRIHRFYIVNIEKVVGIFLSENKIKIGDVSLPLGRKYKKDFLNRINEFRYNNM